MADVSKLKRNTLGAPPPMEEASNNLHAPEAVPVVHVQVTSSEPFQRMDGRSARRTNRTLQFATRVRPEWDAELRSLARRDGLLLVEVLERALELYKNKKASG
ncbi:hypothetical protein [Acidithiobacillus sp.]|uniref:hypothetical protein n=1 Tax=Acidithiobacillus sp. TaxID=1872118 RepID=UPI0025C64A6C|nr:hypothetical protein [Acidithiobacillus sp.]